MIMEQNIDDKFPVGMRVLAVDDDPTCLRLLETLLRKCQYHVTTTSQAITALKMLRENKDKFDLVISDVHMPDMDGFKLLERVGLELDLPVIMLSAYGDNKLVMKGITHGACDYLLKPVRIEELKNIWQHVIRRKKFDPNPNDKKEDVSKPQGDDYHHHYHDQTDAAKLNIRKRKDQKSNDQTDEDDEEHEENGNEDPSTQKKPRVVWSIELHRKFVAAVNHLGIDKAVPKRILDMMNVEKLTRENVASHLQKYRLYLKRISSVASEQANMMAALGSADSAYMTMASFNGFGNLQAMAGSPQFQHSTAFSSSSSVTLNNRLNTPSGLSMDTLSSSRGVQLGQNSRISNNPIILLQGTPMPLEFNQMQRCNQGGTGIGSTNSLFNVVTNNPMMVQGNLLDGQRRIDFQNQPSLVAVNNQLNTDFETSTDDNWATAHSSYALGHDSFKQVDTSSDLRDGISSMSMNMVINHPNPHHGVVGSFNQNLEPRRNTTFFYNKNNNNNNLNSNMLDDPLSSLQHNEVAFLSTELRHDYSQKSTVDSLEDLVSVMTTKQV